MKDPYSESITDEGCLAMREASGRVDSDDPLVCFLYLLMRDVVPAGGVEEVIDKMGKTSPSMFTNGWLAELAIYTAARLTKEHE